MMMKNKTKTKTKRRRRRRRRRGTHRKSAWTGKDKEKWRSEWSYFWQAM